MKPITQEDDLGCAVACVAFVLNISYSQALEKFIDGAQRAKGKANFYCPEIVRILKASTLNFKWKKITEENRERIYQDKSIVFIKKSENHPHGHFLCRYKDRWMDPWINLPHTIRKGGFLKDLPGEPTYVIYSLEESS